MCPWIQVFSCMLSTKGTHVEYVVLLVVFVLVVASVNHVSKRARAGRAPQQHDNDVRPTASSRSSLMAANPPSTTRSRGIISFRTPIAFQDCYQVKMNAGGVYPTPCRICGKKGYWLLVTITDADGMEFRCCVFCFREHAHATELEKVLQLNGISSLLQTQDAIDSLVSHFPDPEKRPAGEYRLREFLESPFVDPNEIERLIAKINSQQWTQYDLARIDGRPEPDINDWRRAKRLKDKPSK